MNKKEKTQLIKDLNLRFWIRDIKTHKKSLGKNADFLDLEIAQAEIDILKAVLLKIKYL